MFTASDLVTSQLAQISVVNGQGTVVDSVNYPVVSNVVPSGVAFDTTRIIPNVGLSIRSRC